MVNSRFPSCKEMSRGDGRDVSNIWSEGLEKIELVCRILDGKGYYLYIVR